jgi:hypothetical protein
MGIGKKLVVGMVVVAFLLAGLVQPRPALADSLSTPIIIGAAAGGAVALILIIAIIFAKKDDVDMPLVEREAKLPKRNERAVGWAHQCRPDGPNLTLLCW